MVDAVEQLAPATDDTQVVFAFNSGGVHLLYDADASEAENQAHHACFRAEVARRARLQLNTTGVVRSRKPADVCLAVAETEPPAAVTVLASMSTKDQTA